MTTLYSLLLGRCSLSLAEAAALHDVRPDTAKSWFYGRRQPPPGAVDQLVELYRRIDNAAAELLAEIERQTALKGSAPAAIELGYAADDHEARSLGWPCVGAHLAALGLVVARGLDQGYRFRVVARGSTPATAAAIEAHQP